MTVCRWFMRLPGRWRVVVVTAGSRLDQSAVPSSSPSLPGRLLWFNRDNDWCDGEFSLVGTLVGLAVQVRSSSRCDDAR